MLVRLNFYHNYTPIYCINVCRSKKIYRSAIHMCTIEYVFELLYDFDCPILLFCVYWWGNRGNNSYFWTLSWYFCVLTCFHMTVPELCLSASTLRKKNHNNFVYVSIAVVIHVWMERSWRVLQHRNPKILFSLQKS